MAEYIEREAVLSQTEILTVQTQEYGRIEVVPVEYIADLPIVSAADVAPVVHGRWIYNTDDFTPAKKCSICGYNKPVAAGEKIQQEPESYCSSCGAKMEEVR